MDNEDALDPVRYGVVLRATDGRRGVLLPAIEGVETVAAQLAIVRRKAGIDEGEAVTMERFAVEKFAEDRLVGGVRP